MSVQRDRVALCSAALVLLLVVLAGTAVSLSAASGSISITPTTAVLEVQQSTRLIASRSKVSWSSSNPAVATVNSLGVVTAKAAGTASIIAKYRKLRGTANITVNTKYVPPAPLALTCPTAINAVSQDGNPVAVNYTISYSGGVSPVSVVGIPASGSLFAVGTTTVNVTGQSGDSQRATCSFSVTVTYTPVVEPPSEPPTEPPTEPPSEPTFGQIMQGIRPRGFGASTYTPLAPAAGRVSYYVSTTGSDTNPGTRSAPFRTINKAAQVALAGDVVTIVSGTYSESVSVKNGGTATAPIVFQAEVLGGVVLTGGSYVFGPANWTGGLVNTGAVYVTVKGLTFRHYAPFGTDAEALRGIRGWRIEDAWFDAAADNAVNLRGDNIVVTRSTFTDNNRHAIVAWGPCGSATGPDQLVGIKGLVVSDNVIRGNNPSTTQPAAGSGSAVVKILASKGALIENNESGENYGPGLWLDSCNADYLVQYNYLHDNIYRYVRARGLDIEISWRGTVRRNVIAGNDQEGLNINNTSGLLVEDNLFNHNRRSIVITAAARGAQFPCRDNLVQNNQFRDWFEYASIEGLMSMTNPSYPRANNIVVDDNTYQPVTSNTFSGWWGYFINSISTNCSNVGWDCRSHVGQVAWPPQ